MEVEQSYDLSSEQVADLIKTVSHPDIKVNLEASIKALLEVLKYATKTKDNSFSLVPTEEHVQLIVTPKVTPKFKIVPRLIKVPHSLQTEKPQVCYFVANNKRKADMKQKEIPAQKIISLDKLNSTYKPFEAKRKLVGSYSLFVTDSDIYEKVIRAVGKIFIKARKVPYRLNKKEDFQKQINAINSSVPYYVSNGASAIKVAPSNFLVLQIMENLAAILASKVIDWDNVSTLHIKTSKSPALPIYNSPIDPVKLAIREAVHNRKRKADEPAENDDAEDNNSEADEPEQEDEDDANSDDDETELSNKKRKTETQKTKPTKKDPEPQKKAVQNDEEKKTPKKTAQTPSKKDAVTPTKKVTPQKAMPDKKQTPKKEVDQTEEKKTPKKDTPKKDAVTPEKTPKKTPEKVAQTEEKKTPKKDTPKKDALTSKKTPEKAPEIKSAEKRKTPETKRQKTEAPEVTPEKKVPTQKDTPQKVTPQKESQPKKTPTKEALPKKTPEKTPEKAAQTEEKKTPKKDTPKKDAVTPEKTPKKTPEKAPEVKSAEKRKTPEPKKQKTPQGKKQ